MSFHISSLRRMSSEHPFFAPESLYRVVIEPTVQGNHGRDSIEHYLSGRSREAALKDWEEGRSAEPPLNWGFSADINGALQDYLKRTRTPTNLASSDSTPASARSAASNSQSAFSTSRTSPSEIPCVIVIAVRNAIKDARIEYDADMFPGCGAKCAAAAPPPAITQGRFTIRVDLSEFLPETRVLVLLLRGEQIARLGRVLTLPLDENFPDVHTGLEEAIEGTRPLRDAKEAAAILLRLSREIVGLEEERRREISDSGVSFESNDAEWNGSASSDLDEDDPENEWSWEHDLGLETPESSRVSAEFRRYFWIVSLLASAPVLDGQTKGRRGGTVFEESFLVDRDVRFPASDLYCVLLVDG